MKKKKINSGGYIAISSVLVILAVVLTITLSVTLLSIDGAQVALSESQSRRAISFVESCVVDELIHLSNNDSLHSFTVLPEGTCTVVEDYHAANTNNWLFTTTGSIDGFSRSIQVRATKTNTIVINSWEEY